MAYFLQEVASTLVGGLVLYLIVGCISAVMTKSPKMVIRWPEYI